MDILFEEANDTLKICLLGELDHHSCMGARERIGLKLSTGCYRNIIYHLEGLTFMDSSGIGLIANGCKIASIFNTKVYIYTKNPKHLKIFTLSKMDELATLLTSRKELEPLWKLPTKCD
ncbi:MAG: anti-sigma F factor antagonist [Clostridia bacterium]|nr:anti-sigma F factor antagonist [Clostridia bacterium]